MITKFDWLTYPAHDDYRGGSKVSWYYYRSHEDARQASIAAKHNAIRQEQLGYDFGYCAPGEITKVNEGDKAGMWEVCIP